MFHNLKSLKLSLFTKTTKKTNNNSPSSSDSMRSSSFTSPSVTSLTSPSTVTSLTSPSSASSLESPAGFTTLTSPTSDLSLFSSPPKHEPKTHEKKKSKGSKIPFGYKILFAIPDKHLFRLVVDGDKQKKDGFQTYESTEKGSISNVLEAILLGLTEDTLSVPLIKEIHKTCRKGLKLEKSVAGGEFTTNNLHGFPIYHLTVEGLYDLCQFSINYSSISPQFMLESSMQQTPNYLIDAKKIDDEFRKIRYKNKENEFLKFIYIVDVENRKSEKIILKMIDRLNSLLTTKNDNEFIQAIVDFIYDLEHLHPFGDVNLRTNIVIADILLMLRGFPPVCYPDPNYLDGCSKQEFFNIIKKGMLTTLEMIEKPNAPYFGFDSKSVEKIPEYSAIIDPIVKAKEEYDYQQLSPYELGMVKSRVLSLHSYAQSNKVLFESQFNIENSREFSPVYMMMKSRKMIKQKEEALEDDHEEEEFDEECEDDKETNESIHSYEDERQEEEGSDESFYTEIYRAEFKKCIDAKMSEEAIIKTCKELPHTVFHDLGGGLTTVQLMQEAGFSYALIKKIVDSTRPRLLLQQESSQVLPVGGSLARH